MRIIIEFSCLKIKFLPAVFFQERSTNNLDIISTEMANDMYPITRSSHSITTGNRSDACEINFIDKFR